MKNIFKKITLFVLFLIVGITHAQTSNSFSELIMGKWIGSGTLFGNEANFTMYWKNELSDKFVELSFENRFKDKSGVERVMNATAFYQLKHNKGYWFDSRGIMLPLTLEINKQSMTVLWGDENSERGKTIYNINNEDQVVVQDFVYKDGNYYPFGEASYERVKD